VVPASLDVPSYKVVSNRVLPICLVEEEEVCEVSSCSQINSLAGLGRHSPKLILVSSAIVAKNKFLKIMEVKLQRPFLVTNRLKQTAHHRMTEPEGSSSEFIGNGRVDSRIVFALINHREAMSSNPCASQYYWQVFRVDNILEFCGH